MTLARNTEGYNLLKALVESYGANKVRETVTLIVGLDVSDPEDARHRLIYGTTVTVDERVARPVPGTPRTKHEDCEFNVPGCNCTSHPCTRCD